MTRIGVLALQGDFREHITVLRELGAGAFPVRLPSDLDGVDGLIIPGGESTVMGKLMVAYGLDQPLRDLIAGGRAGARGDEHSHLPECVRPAARQLRDAAEGAGAGRDAVSRGVHSRAGG